MCVHDMLKGRQWCVEGVECWCAWKDAHHWQVRRNERWEGRMILVIDVVNDMFTEVVLEIELIRFVEVKGGS